MSTTITRNHCFLGLSDELAAQHFPDKDGPLDIPSECAVKLVPRGSLSSSRDSGYEEIFTCRNRLVWSCHGRVRMRVEASKCIADAALCPMIEDDASVHLLCVAEPTTLSIYGTEGDIHQHTLPSPVKRLWPTPAGLVVELSDVKPAYLIQNSITGLEEVTAITSHDLMAPAYAWNNDSILFLSPDSPFAVTTRNNGRIVRVWCLKAFPEGALPDKQSGVAASGGKPYADMHAHTPGSVYTNRSRVRTPDDHIHPFIFSQFRSQTMPGTESTMGAGKVYLPSVSVQLAFVLCYVDEIQQGVADDACRIQVPDGESVLAIHTSNQQVIFFTCDSSGGVMRRSEALADISCIASLDMSASATPATGLDMPRCGLLALDTSGRLWLHHGTERLLQVSIPPDTPVTPEQVQYFPPARPASLQGKLNVRTEPHSDFALKSEADEPQGLTMRDLGQAVDVSHACGKTFLLHFAGGENIQVHVDVDSHTELIGKCMHALQAIMDPPDYRRLLQKYYRGSHLAGDEIADWKQFSAFILRYWQEQLTEQAPCAPRKDRSEAAEPMDAWQALMALDETQALLQARLYPAFFSLVESVAEDAHTESKMDDNPTLPVLRGDSRNGFADSLGALHSIFEDLALDMTLWRHLPYLAALLACMSSLLGQTEWQIVQEYYGRHLQAASRLDLLPKEEEIRPLVQMEPMLPAPPCVQDALHNLVAEVPIDPAHAVQLPLLVKRRAGVVQRSIDLLRIFRVLKHTTEELCSLMLEEAMAESQVAAARRRGSLEILNLLGDLGWNLMDIDCLPFGIALPVHGALQGLREDPPVDLSPAKYILLGREDIAATVICMAEAHESQLEGPDPMPLGGEMSGLAAMESTSMSVFHTPHLHPPSPSRSTLASGKSTGHSHGGIYKGIKSYKPVWQCSPGGTPVHPVVGTALQEQWTSRFVLGPISAQRLGLPGSDLSAPETQCDDKSRGQADRPSADDPSLSDLNSQFYRMRFGRDLRLSEALRVLSFSRHVQLPSAATGDAETQAQVKLAFHATRTLALPLGRGALTLNTVNLLPTEPLHAHPLVLDGRVPNKNNAVTVFDMSAFASAPCGGAENEMTAWPEFHAGASAALRVIPSSSNLIRYWLLFKKPPTPTYVHAGMLFSLGLSGELKSLSSPNQYRYLCQEHTAIMVGLLIGLAASHRGSMDEATSRTLNMHIPARHASVFGELEIAPLTQAAAMVGLGLLYEGSGHQDTSEMLLHEIVRRPSSSQAGNAGGPNTGGEASAVTVNQDREAYTLSAGFALGLINIGKGRWSSGVSNGSIAETLRRLIVGGAWASSVQPMALWQADQRSSKMPSDDSAPSHGLSQVVLEGSLVNLEVTSPAATIALMLMFLKTNDAAVADMLVLPDTTFNLDFIRPSDILLRVVARSLIMWDSIEPTREWVMQQMPPVIRMRWPEALEAIKAAVAEGREFDHEAVLLAHLHAVTGSCLALGLRYAGTAVEEARATLQEMIIYILQCRKTLAEIKAAVEGFSIDAIIIERMAAVCAMALGALRKRLNVSDVPMNTANATTVSRGYGVHMAIGMSIGFLFLGGACYKFNTSNKSVAMLLISMWPALPCSPSDNRCHLQALRHLYALACNKRVMRAVDVNIRQPVYVPVSLAMAATDHASAPNAGIDRGSENQPANLQAQGMSSRENSGHKISEEVCLGREATSSPYPKHAIENRSIGLDGLPTCGHTPAGPTVSSTKQVTVTERLSPCLMPEPDLLRGVQVGGSRYWPQSVDAGKHGLLTQALCDRAALFVKKRAHALAYQDDPTGVRSLLSTLVSPAGLASPTVPGSYDLLHICATFSTDPVITSFGLAFCQHDQGGHQHAACEAAPANEASGSFLWRLLSEGVMQETAHLLPTQLSVFYSFQTLGDCASIQHPRPPRKFHFPWGAAGRLVSSPPVHTHEDANKHAASLMPSSPMSEDEAMCCEDETSALPPLPTSPHVAPCTMGWGSSAVATSAGPLQIVQNLVMANAYLAQVHVQSDAASSRPGQAQALGPAFLQSCSVQLEQVWKQLEEKPVAMEHVDPCSGGRACSVLQEALHSKTPLSPSQFLSMAGVGEADKFWKAAMIPLYLAFHRANDVTQLKAETTPFVSKLREVLDDSEVAMVLSSALGLPPAVASSLV